MTESATMKKTLVLLNQVNGDFFVFFKRWDTVLVKKAFFFFLRKGSLFGES